LAAKLGVSRLTVREAMRTLEARGLLETRRGRVPTVAAPSGALVGDFFKSAIRRDPRAALELVEVRMALEAHIAALAAQRATRTALAQSEMALAAMWEAEDDSSAFNEADVRFHESLAAATGNRLLFWIIEAFAEPLHEGRLKSFAGHLARGGTTAPLIRQHEKILDAVKARDAQGAAEAMRRHLRETEKDLRAALSVESTDDYGNL
jgi:GntR family transcriptional repressor for pyruvate dehydrogenase complex